MNILSLNSRGVASELKQHWIKGLCREHKFQLLETFTADSDQDLIKALGAYSFEFEFVKVWGRSLGILYVWDLACFYGVTGPSLTSLAVLLMFMRTRISEEKKRLRENIISIISSRPDYKWVVFGDFNEVRSCEERKGKIFSFSGAALFNGFINEAGLIEVKCGGKRFSRVSSDGSKLRLLDRLFVSSNFLSRRPNPSAVILPRRYSDHSPLLFKASVVDFVPSYFKCFNSWLKDPLLFNIKNTWMHQSGRRFNSHILAFFSKLQSVKCKIKMWRHESRSHLLGKESELKLLLEALESNAESSSQEWLVNLKKLEKQKILDLKQKSRIKWAIDGDENSRFYHGIINHNRRINFIHCLYMNGSWVVDLLEIKSVAFNYFSNKFASSGSRRPRFFNNGFSKLSPDQSC
ncbi:LOW QUALITY PROTEIN: hypothetical protein OSB04_003543 [Centaurea solstitialis]|uniref:Uncharacterized protein n=1 Tax=Centaurea solstitialis TaxID=347529 RepID=A0AA38WNW7_9ASTR|nr:LOW QUALITY PROTEIN: hypothetical protein OSB04_003543 [Centaurea solstitialis]